jgi:hypothetical protein
MISQQYILRALLVLSCGYALWRGNRDARIVGLICIAATLATRFAASPVSVRYSGVELGLLAIDAAVLIGFVAVALRSDRFWPLWVAGLQLTTSTAHLMKAVDESLLPIAYGAAVALWSYPILIILAIGTWRGHRRMRSQHEFNSAI